MKILLMNPQIDAEHAISKALAAREIAVLHAADAEEGWKLLQLHGKSVDLALIHLEGQSNPEEGLALVRRLKADSSQADLPFVISSAVWDDSRFAEHQGTPQGANAYLHWPFSAGQFCELLGSLFPSEGTSEIARPASPSVPPPPPASLTGSLTKTRNEAPRPAFPAAPSALPVDSGTGSFDSAALVLEDASHIFKAPVSPSAKECSDRISLEVPEMPPEPAEAAPAQESAQESAPVAEVMEIAELASPEAIELVPLSPPVLDPPTRVIPDSAVALSLELSNPGFGSAEPSMVSMNPTEPAHEPDVADSNLVLSVDAVLEAAAEEAVMAIPPSAPAEHEPRIDERESQVDERELAAEMPYLFSAAREASEPAPNAALAFSHPVGDAVVPGGAAQSPDVETLKKYLLLREQDVAVLSSQLTAAQAQLQELEGQLRVERSTSADLQRRCEEQQRRIEEFDRERQLSVEGLQGEISELRFQMRAKTDKVRLMESQVKEATGEIERLKDRVRADIRKIRVREKELENKLEILKKDSEALISARENKIVELKRKVDLLEFNMDLLQDQHAREKESSARLREKLAKAAQVVRVAGGLLDANGGVAAEQAGTPNSRAEAPLDGTVLVASEDQEKAS